MKLKVIRSVFTPQTSLGKMYLNNQFYAYTGEDTVRDLYLITKPKNKYENP